MKAHGNSLYKNAIKWWSDLTKSQKRDYEFKAYGYGEEFEDNSLCAKDYIDLYKKFANLNYEKTTTQARTFLRNLCKSL